MRIERGRCLGRLLRDVDDRRRLLRVLLGRGLFGGLLDNLTILLELRQEHQLHLCRVSQHLSENGVVRLKEGPDRRPVVDVVSLSGIITRATPPDDARFPVARRPTSQGLPHHHDPDRNRSHRSRSLAANCMHPFAWSRYFQSNKPPPR